MLSYYNTETKRWLCHYKFEDDEGSIDENTSFAYAVKKKVLRVFRFDTRSGEFGIGVLFHDGTLRQISFSKDSTGSVTMRETQMKAEIKGKILGIASDREHQRILYVISEVEG